MIGRTSKAAVSTTSNLSLDCKVDFSKIICLEFQGVERLIRIITFGEVFGLKLLRQTAGAVFTCTSTFRFWLTLSCYD